VTYSRLLRKGIRQLFAKKNIKKAGGNCGTNEVQGIQGGGGKEKTTIHKVQSSSKRTGRAGG